MQINKEIKKTNLSYKDFQSIRLLGLGAYAKVELVSFQEDLYALKVIPKKLLAKEGKEYQALVQKQILLKMKHPGIIQLVNCFQDKKNVYFCLEYCEGGDFTSFLRNNQQKITGEVRKFYIAEIVSILQYLQSITVIHRDLKPQNILLDKNGHLKLVDFGTAEISQCQLIDPKVLQQVKSYKLINSDEYEFQEQDFPRTCSSTDKSQSFIERQRRQASPKRRRKATFVGTCNYIAPELLETDTCSYSSDLWALGCIIYQFYYLNPPFDGLSQYEIFEKVQNLEYGFPPNRFITDEAKDLIKKLLKKNPLDRLGSNSKVGLMMSDLKSHPFFKGISFDKLFIEKVPLIVEDTKSVSSKILKKLNQLQISSEQQYFNKIRNQFLDHFPSLKKNKVVIMHGVVQKRTFIFYNLYYLIVFSNMKVLRVKILEPTKTRLVSIKLEDNSQDPAAKMDENIFLLQTDFKVYKYRTNALMEWVGSINEGYKQWKRSNCENVLKIDEIVEEQIQNIRKSLDSLRIQYP